MGRNRFNLAGTIFLKLHQWVAPDNTPFLRFLFLIEAPEQLATQPHDDDINGCYWVTAQEIINSQQLRSPLVKESILCYQQNERYPLSLLDSFGSTFAFLTMTFMVKKAKNVFV